jgi:hypothetical protein
MRGSGIVVTPPALIAAAIPAYFTITITGSPLDLTIAWGDQTVTNLGFTNQSVVAHVYRAPGTYFLRIAARGEDGQVTTAMAPMFVK